MGYSNDNFWKLDKWDKIGIASLIVFFTIFVVLNTFCFGAVSVGLEWHKGFYYDYIENAIQYSSSLTNAFLPTFYISGDLSVTVTNTSDNIVYAGALSRTFEHGSKIKYLGNISPGSSQTFNFSSSDYKYFVVYTSTGFFTDSQKSDLVVDITSLGMSSAITLLINNITFDNLWSVFNNAIPYILIVVLVAFGFYLIAHAIREVSKGRDV